MARDTRIPRFAPLLFAFAFAASSAVVGAEETPPAPAPTPQPAPAQQTTPQPVLRPVAPSSGLYVIPTQSTGKPSWSNGANSDAAKAGTSFKHRERDLQPLAVFGLSVGVQALGTALTLAFAGANYGLSDRSVEVGYGVMLGITPIADGIFGWLLMRRSERYDAPLFSTMIGAYLGAAISYICVYYFQEADDPKVDGKYDDVWFQSDGADSRVAGGAFALVILPVLVPAIGAGLGALVGRKPLKKPERLTLTPSARLIGVGGSF